MNITKATYGGVDCLPQVKSKIRGERLVLRVDNNIIGDTQVGTVKFLEIEINGELHSIREGGRYSNLCMESYTRKPIPRSYILESFIFTPESTTTNLTMYLCCKDNG